MFKTPSAKYVLPEIIVSERNVFFMQKSRFLSSPLLKNHPSKVPFGLLNIIHPVQSANF